MKNKSVLIICIDIDNDLGRKAGVNGPIMGKKDNLNAAVKLAVKDPYDSDSNCIFAGIKKYNDLEKHFSNRELVTLTGHEGKGFEAHKNINEQLEFALEKFPSENFVIVTDGASDDEVLPILQSRGKIISKELVIVRQAKEVESAYYTIKEALKDPYIARVVFGIPGIILLLLFALPNIGLQIIMFAAGAYLIAKGFGIEERIAIFFRDIPKTMNIHRISFPFYLGAILVFGFGIFSAFTSYSGIETKDILIRIALTLQSSYLLFALSGTIFVAGKIIDCVLFKKAFLLKKYSVSVVSVLLTWLILDSATRVFVGETDINYFLLIIVFSFAVLLIAFKLSNVFEIRNKITRMLVGMPVYNEKGKWLGRVEKISEKRDALEFVDNKTKSKVKIGKEKMRIREGKIFTTEA